MSERSVFMLGLRPYLILVAVCFVLYMPGFDSLPAVDRDEARFVQATRQMLESGDYVVVRFQDDLRAKKPAGIYWAQAAAVRLLSTPDSTKVWPYRLPSFFAALAAVLLTFHFGSMLLDRPSAFLGAVGLATSMVLSVEARLATTDAALLACTTLAQGCLGLLYVQYRSRGDVQAPRWAWVGFWLGIAAAILVKGPITPAIVLLTILTLCIRHRQTAWLRLLKPVHGLVLTTILVVPWMWAVSHLTGGAFLSRAVQEDLFPKLIGGQEGHWAPPGTHTLSAALTLWPASLFLVPALWLAWRRRPEASTYFLLAWALPSWVMFELVPTKLFHYTLPLFPPLTLLIGVWVAPLATELRPIWKSWPAWCWSFWWGVAGLALAAVLIRVPLSYGDGLTAWSVTGTAAALASIPIAWWFVRQGADTKGFLALAVAAGIVQVALFSDVAPRAQGLWVSERAIRTLQHVAPGSALAVAGYSEPSIVFENGTATQLLTAQQAAVWLMKNPSRAALIEERELPAFTAGLPTPAAANDRTVIEGFNYSNGHTVKLHLFVPAARAAGLQPQTAN